MTKTDKRQGRIKGEYNKFVTGHNSNGKTNPMYGKSRPDMIGANNILWQGGRKKHHGYIQILKPDHPFCNKQGYVFEHRLVVERQIGRYLKTKKEVIHHINGTKDDNCKENLMAFINESAHQRFHINPTNVKLEEIIYDGKNQL